MQGKMRRQREGAKGADRAYLAGVLGYCGAAAKDGAWESDLRDAKADYRTGIRGREGETRDAIYTSQRLGRGHEMGQA